MGGAQALGGSGVELPQATSKAAPLRQQPGRATAQGGQGHANSSVAPRWRRPVAAIIAVLSPQRPPWNSG
jgi:hypothetical protein